MIVLANILDCLEGQIDDPETLLVIFDQAARFQEMAGKTSKSSPK